MYDCFCAIHRCVINDNECRDILSSKTTSYHLPLSFSFTNRTGAMSYRAGSNALLGPGSTMLAALGGASSSYHLFKMLQWRSYKQHRVEMIEKGWWSGGGTMKETERWMNDGDGGAEPRSD